MITIVLIYWAFTTIFGIYWLIKNPSVLEDPDEFSILEVLGHLFPAAILGWVFVPMVLLHQIKFKRHGKRK
jgi:hypothetical protein